MYIIFNSWGVKKITVTNLRQVLVRKQQQMICNFLISQEKGDYLKQSVSSPRNSCKGGRI